jgi:exoribonuclease-2
MKEPMAEPHIALIRRGGLYILALTRVGADNRWWATGADGKPFRVTRQQFAWETDIVVLDSALAQWIGAAEQLATETNVEEAWRVVQGEIPGLSLTDLSELVWSPPVESVQLGALLLSLFAAPLRYFDADALTLKPLAEEEVTAQIERRDQHQQAANEESTFIAWLGGTSSTGNDSAELTPRQLSWLETIRQYAVEGDSSTAAKAVKGWLRQVQQTQDPQKLAFELLVRRGEMDEDEFFTLRRLGVKTTFSDEVLAEAERLAALAVPLGHNRRDLSALDVFTIDEASTVDIDDGLSVQRTPTGYEVGVHIADAAAMVPAVGLIEDAARERMTSLYLPEGTLPMLPRQLSEVAGSLVPGGIRPAISLLAQMDDGFKLQSWELYRSLVRSAYKLSYEEADAALMDSTAPYGEPLKTLNAVAQPLRESRLASGALEMDRPELKVRVNESKNISVSVTPMPTLARRLVAEFMVLMNNCIGTYLRDNDIPAIYRSQDPVDLEDVPDTSVNAVRQFHILRRIRPARLSTTPGLHALIGVEPYVQATSPLRRYADLVNQRQLASKLDGNDSAYSMEEVKTVLFRADATLRDLGRAENERQRYWIHKLLSGKLGDEFSAVVLDIRDRQYVVELETYLIRSNVYLRPGTTPGETVQLVLQEVDAWRQQAHFRQAD